MTFFTHLFSVLKRVVQRWANTLFRNFSAQKAERRSAGMQDKSPPAGSGISQIQDLFKVCSVEKKKYKILDAKKFWFSSYRVIDSTMDLMAMLREYQMQGFVFRGQADASWTIRSSALRWWQDAHPQTFDIPKYLDFLNEALLYTKRSGYQELQLQCNKGLSGVWFGDHERFGFLQHYGFPTPLIDFTYEFKVALFMALRDTEVKASHFSIYLLDPKARLRNELYSFERLVRDNADSNDLKRMCLFYHYENRIECGWCQYPCVLIHKDGELWCSNIARERLASQSGLFVYTKDELPLEQQLAGYKWWDWLDKMGVDVSEKAPGLDFAPLQCIDVPYHLAPTLRTLLKEEGCTEESFGLADKGRDNVAKACFDDFVRAHTK